MVLTEQADGVLFVVAEGRTSRSVAQRALQLLESSPAPILGVVANMSARSEVSSYYGTSYAAYRPPSDGGTADPGGRSPTWRHRSSR
jgi:Mrp family chromosome partitioning ATPase